MTEVKHTRGKWELTNEITGCVAVREPEYQMVASVYPCQTGGFSILDDWPKKAEMLANANLIAAAPDLLEALKWAVSHQPSDDSCEPWASDARAAIAKAEGRA